MTAEAPTPPHTSPSEKLTDRQARSVRARLEGKSSRRAALEAGYAPSTAQKANRLIASSPAVRAAMAELLEREGITCELLARRIREGLDATIVLRATLHAGREIVVDFKERREMCELAIRLLGLMPTDKHEHRLTLEDLLEASYREI